MPVIGAVIVVGGLLLYVFYIPPLLIGALIGGLMTQQTENKTVAVFILISVDHHLRLVL